MGDEDERRVLAYHVIFSTYGFWLPNDPRGSWSTDVRNPDLLTFGEATKVETPRSVAHRRAIPTTLKPIGPPLSSGSTLLALPDPFL